MTPEQLLASLPPELQAAFQQIMAEDPQAAAAIAQKASTPEGMQQIIAALTEMVQAMAQQAPPPAPPQAGPPPSPNQGVPNGPIGPPTPPAPPVVGTPGVGTPSVPAGGPSGGNVPASPPTQAPVPPPLESQLPPNLLTIFRQLTPEQRAQVEQGYLAQGPRPVIELLTQIEQAGGVKALNGGAGSPKKAQKMQDEQGEKKKKPRDKKAPEFELGPLPKNRWGESGPKYETVVRHKDEGKRRWKSRDERIAEDVEMYNLARSRKMPGGRSLDEGSGDVLHTSSRPYQFVERVAGICTPTHDKLSTQVPPWSDDDDTRFAAQALKDWFGYSREVDEERWFRRGAAGDPRMPLGRQEAAMMALMGGCGFRLEVDPDDKNHPIHYEIIPLNRLYPLPYAFVHCTQGSLDEMRNVYPEIDDYYPPQKEGGPDANEQVEVIGWTDAYAGGKGGLWHCIAWSIGGEWGGADEKAREKWIKKPTRIDYGFPMYQYVIWGGAPYWNTQDIDEYERHRGMGVLTQLRRTFRLMDSLTSAVATGAFKAVDPPKLQTYLPGTRKEDMTEHDTSPGATSYGIVGENTIPLMWEVAGNRDFQAIFQQLQAELADMDSPLLKGAPGGNSGFQQVQLNQAAGSVQVAPIMDALESMYQLVNTLRAELVIRKGIGDGREIDNLPYSSSGVGDYTTDYEVAYEQQGMMRYITPKQVKLNGTRNKVRFDRTSLPEQQMLWNMLGQAVQSKLISAQEAMIRMGIGNPERNLLRILQEAAVMNPKALDAMIGAAALGGGNQLFSYAWLKATEQPAQPAPEQKGIPSAAGVSTGGPGGAPPAAAVGQQGVM